MRWRERKPMNYIEQQWADFLKEANDRNHLLLIRDSNLCGLVSLIATAAMCIFWRG